MASLQRRDSCEDFANSPDSDPWMVSDSENESTIDDVMALDDSLTSLQWLQNVHFNLDVSQETSDGCRNSTALQQQSTYCATSAAQAEAPNTPTTGAMPTSGQKGANRGDDIDYRTDASIKPPYSYATLICMAMKATNQTKITLSCIYKWIVENFMYYRKADSGWQNSIRHNLSLNKCFIKVPRTKDDPGKGGYWKINPEYEDSFENGVFKRRRHSSGVKSTSSSDGSVSPKSASRKTSRSCRDRDRNARSATGTSPNRKGAESKRRVKHGNTEDTKRVKEETVVDDADIEDAIGVLKGELSWSSILELPTSCEELAQHVTTLDTPGLDDLPGFSTVPLVSNLPAEHFQRCSGSPITSFTPPASVSSADGCDQPMFDDIPVKTEPVDFDSLTSTVFLPGSMPPSPPPFDHPWAERRTATPFDFDKMLRGSYLTSMQIPSLHSTFDTCGWSPLCHQCT